MYHSCHTCERCFRQAAHDQTVVFSSMLAKFGKRLLEFYMMCSKDLSRTTAPLLGIGNRCSASQSHALSMKRIITLLAAHWSDWSVAAELIHTGKWRSLVSCKTSFTWQVPPTSPSLSLTTPKQSKWVQVYMTHQVMSAKSSDSVLGRSITQSHSGMNATFSVAILSSPAAQKITKWNFQEVTAYILSCVQALKTLCKSKWGQRQTAAPEGWKTTFWGPKWHAHHA